MGLGVFSVDGSDKMVPNEQLERVFEAIISNVKEKRGNRRSTVHIVIILHPTRIQLSAGFEL